MRRVLRREVGVPRSLACSAEAASAAKAGLRGFLLTKMQKKPKKEIEVLVRAIIRDKGKFLVCKKIGRKYQTRIRRA